jgi:hypothetical protein
MNRFVDRRLIPRDGDGVGRVPGPWLLNPLINILVRCGILKEDLDYYVLRGASWFLACCEWTFGTLLLLGFWNKKLGILGASARA